MDGASLRRAAVFRAVAAHGGINAAARALGKSPPAVHHDLQRFQAGVAAPLFQRVGRRLVLTPAGRALNEAIARALDDMERTLARLQQDAPEALPLRIGCVSGFGRYRLAPRLLASLPPTRPLELQFGAHDDVLARVLRNDLDFGVTYRPVVAAPVASTPLAEEELVLAAPAGRAPPGVDEVAGLPFVTYDEYEYVFGRWFEAVLGRQPAPLRRLDHASELEEAVASVAAGRGCTIAPFDALAPWRDHVQAVRPGPARCANTLHLLALGDGLERPDARLVLAVMADGE